MTSITGRDRYIVAKALAYAIITIERLPETWREESDKEDMQLLLNHYAPDRVATVLASARGHIERRGVTVENGELVVAPRPLGDIVPFPE